MEIAPTLNPRPNGNWTLIIALILAAIFLFLLNSCVTLKQRERILKDCVTSSYRKDSIQIIVKDKLMPYEIHDTIPYWLPNPCANLCDSAGNLKTNFSSKISSKDGSELDLKVKNNKLIIDDNVNLKDNITIKDTSINHITTIKEQVHENCKLKHLTDWDIFWIKVGQILSGLIGGAILLLVLKKLFIK